MNYRCCDICFVQLFLIWNANALSLVPINRTVIKQNGTTRTVSRYLFLPHDADANQTLTIKNNENLSEFLKEFEDSKAENPDANKKVVDSYRIYIKRKLKGRPEDTVRTVKKKSEKESKDFIIDNIGSTVNTDNQHTNKKLNLLNITVLHSNDSEDNNYKFDDKNVETGEFLRREDQQGSEEADIFHKLLWKSMSVYTNKDKSDMGGEFDADSVKVIPLPPKNISAKRKTVKEKTLMENENTKTIINSEIKKWTLDEFSQKLNKSEVLGSKLRPQSYTFIAESNNGKAKININKENIQNGNVTSKNDNDTAFEKLLVTLHNTPEKYLDETLNQGQISEQYTPLQDKQALLNQQQNESLKNTSNLQTLTHPIITNLNERTSPSSVQNLLLALHETPEKFIDQSLKQEFGTEQYKLLPDKQTLINKTQEVSLNSTSNLKAFIHPLATNFYGGTGPSSVELKDVYNDSLKLSTVKGGLNINSLSNYPEYNITLAGDTPQKIVIQSTHLKPLNVNQTDQHFKSEDYFKILQNVNSPSVSNNQKHIRNYNQNEYELLHEFILDRNISELTKNIKATGNKFYDNQNNQINSFYSTQNFDLTDNSELFENLSQLNAFQVHDTGKDAETIGFPSDVLINTDSNQGVNTYIFSNNLSQNDYGKIPDASFVDLTRNDASSEKSNGTDENRLRALNETIIQDNSEGSENILQKPHIEFGSDLIQTKTFHEHANYPDTHYKLTSECPECDESISQLYNIKSGPKQVEVQTSKINASRSIKYLPSQQHYRDSLITPTDQGITEFSQNVTSIHQKNKHPINGDKEPNKILRVISKIKTAKNIPASNQIPTQLFSVENFNNVLKAIQRSGLINYDKRIFSLYNIIMLILEIAKSGATKNGGEVWFIDDSFVGNPMKEYVYKLIRQKWFQEIIYQLIINNYNINVIRNPRWNIYLNAWRLPTKLLITKLNNVNQNKSIHTNGNCNRLSGSQEDANTLLDYLRHYRQYHRCQRIILSHIAMFMTMKGYPECLIRNIITKLYNALNRSQTMTCLPTYCLKGNL